MIDEQRAIKSSCSPAVEEQMAAVPLRRPSSSSSRVVLGHWLSNPRVETMYA